MKIDFKKLSSKNLFILTDRNKPKTDLEAVEMLKKCVQSIKHAQSRRDDNTIGEMWAADAIAELVDCITLKKG